MTSYNLYRNGMSVADIAAQRELTQETIIRHLGKYVATGEIKLEELVSDEHVAAIRRALATADAADGKAAIKALCPDDVTYSEIDLVIQYKDGDKQMQ